jgi:flavin reductase (DIM6/NTAB) family NADH-FMN oxidoreductase RutF
LTVDPLEFRSISGHFATGVTVITSAAGDELQGMTANAFTALSLAPVMVLVCVDKGSHTHAMIERGGVFAVNILGEHQEDVSRTFAKRSPPEAGSLRGVPFRLGETGAPILEDCLAYLDCRVASALDGGDHSIFLGEVIDEAIVSGGNPLLFYTGRYVRLTRDP